MIEAHFGRRHLLMFDFRDFQECEAHNEASPANLCIRRGGAEVGMIAVHHLGGPLGTSCVGVGNGNNNCRRLNVGNHYPESPLPGTRVVSLLLSLSLYRTFTFAGSSDERDQPSEAQPSINQLC